MRPVTVAARVPGQVDEVFTFVSDTRNDPIWCPNVTNVTLVEGNGVEVGARFRFQQTVTARGRELVSPVEVEIVNLGDHSIEWQVEDKFQTRHVSLTVTSHGPGTAVTQTTTAVFKRKPGVARWVYPMLAKRTLKDQFSRLTEQFS